MAIKIQASKFALLKIEDDDDEDILQNKNLKSKGDSTGANSSKKKTKKTNQTKSNQELKNLIFGQSAPNQKIKQQKQSKEEMVKNDFDKWKKIDQENVDEAFKKDLENAIADSQLQFKLDKEKAESKSTKSDEEKSIVNKKKKKPKSAQSQEVLGSKDNNIVIGVENQSFITDNKLSKLFGAGENRDNFATIAEEIEFKDVCILQIKEDIQILMKELQDMKKQNILLCNMYTQAELKDIPTLMEEVKTLNTTRDQLASQISIVNTDLEKERSKGHSLRAELEKLKVNKHEAVK